VCFVREMLVLPSPIGNLQSTVSVRILALRAVKYEFDY
jgi:hypothetical protein